MASRRIAVWLAAGALAALPPCPAEAAAETLRRSLQNIALAPFDIALAPVSAGHALYRNLDESEESTAVKVAFVVPGFVWNTGVNLLGGALRELAGLLELPPGLVLAGFETQLPPLLDVVERSDALVDAEGRVFHWRLGVDYTSG